MLKGKKILLGVTGSIAAYKAALLTRLLIKEGVEVRVIMTPSAQQFITPLTLATLSKNPVYSEFIKNTQGEWTNHVELGLWADAFVLAPASANTLAKMAHGFCDNLLLATFLSARCPVFFAPAMDLDMLRHPATQSNIELLRQFGHHHIPSAHGELASGLVGTGRMAEPEEIVSHLSEYFHQNRSLAGKNALVTAGPTHEAIDPVRFIGNSSSGKMGIAIAEALANQGANVQLVLGPSHLATQHPSIQTTRVVSAAEMFQAAERHFSEADVIVLSAAVADYRPLHKADQKIKKADAQLNVELTKTTDIAAELGKRKKNGQFMVGFALETENERSNASKKLESKNFDLIVLNSLNDPGAGFGHDTNKVTLIDREGTATEFGLKSKQEVAADIVQAIVDHYHA